MRTEMSAKIYNFQEEKEKRKKKKDKSGNEELNEIFEMLKQKAIENEKFSLKEWNYNDNVIGWTTQDNEHYAIVMIEGLVGIRMKYEDAEKLSAALLTMIKNTK